jgi:hypothetical protein
MANGVGQNVQVNLGCWSLILIAIIVMIFGGCNRMGDVGRQLDRLSEETSGLRRAVERQTERLEALERKLDRPPPAPGRAEAEK